MEQQFQTSFIPQKPLGNSSTPSYTPPKKIVNIFSILATIMFVLALVASAGLYVYQKVITNQITDENKSLIAARATFDANGIQTLVDVSTRIKAVKQVLSHHIAVSQLFGLLQTLTVQKVRFSNFNYSKKMNALTITMDGEAADYSAMAAQSNIFAQNSFIQNPVFSDFDLSSVGTVTFKFSAAIDPSLVSYQQLTASTATTSAPLTQ